MNITQNISIRINSPYLLLLLYCKHNISHEFCENKLWIKSLLRLNPSQFREHIIELCIVLLSIVFIIDWNFIHVEQANMLRLEVTDLHPLYVIRVHTNTEDLLDQSSLDKQTLSITSTLLSKMYCLTISTYVPRGSLKTTNSCLRGLASNSDVLSVRIPCVATIGCVRLTVCHTPVLLDDSVVTDCWVEEGAVWIGMTSCRSWST